MEDVMFTKEEIKGILDEVKELLLKYSNPSKHVEGDYIDVEVEDGRVVVLDLEVHPNLED